MPASTACLSFDFDALSVWLAHEKVTPAMLQRGEYGARVGVPRILDFLDAQELRAMFFIPGDRARPPDGDARDLRRALPRRRRAFEQIGEVVRSLA